MSLHITYIILAHKGPEQVLRLVNALSMNGVTFVIHIDKRSGLDDFIRRFTSLDRKTVYFIKQRSESRWGSFGLVQAVLDCLQFIKKKLNTTDRIVVLSGQDYPIKNNVYIHNYLKANKQTIFLDFGRMPNKKWNAGGIDRFPFYNEFSAQLPVYYGSQWMSFPYGVIQIIFDFLKSNPAYLIYYKAVKIPDESFFQTLLLNCDEEIVTGNIVNKNLHLIKWDKPYIHPRFFKEDNFRLIKKSKALFARKFDANLGSSVLDKIDRELLYKKQQLNINELKKDDLYQKSVVLYLTNKGKKEILSNFSDLKIKTKHFSDTVILYHKTRENAPKAIQNCCSFIFDNDVLHQLNFQGIHRKLLPGSNHFPLFSFYRENPNYSHYWVIEDDIKYNGNWEVFFNNVAKSSITADFLTSHVRNYEEEPNWFWWYTLKHDSGIKIPISKRVRSFNPIYRLSNAALSFLNDAFLNGWTGHHEVSIPTLLNEAGFKIYDLGGQGSFAHPDYKFYKKGEMDSCGELNSGSMRFRPLIKAEEIDKEFLYHPVKIKKN